MLPAFAGLLLFQLIGEALVRWLGVPVPGPLVGMLLLFAALLLRGGVPAGLQQAANGLLRNLMLLFIPAVTGVMLHVERVSREWLAIIGASVLGAAITLAVTVLTLRWAIRLTGGPKQ